MITPVFFAFSGCVFARKQRCSWALHRLRSWQRTFSDANLLPYWPFHQEDRHTLYRYRCWFGHRSGRLYRRCGQRDANGILHSRKRRAGTLVRLRRVYARTIGHRRLWPRVLHLRFQRALRLRFCRNRLVTCVSNI